MFQAFHRLKVSQKLALISIFFIIPDSVMLVLMVTNINESIRFAQWEQKGNSYLRPLEELLEFIPQHQSFTEAHLNGNKNVLDQIVHLQAKIDQAFHSLEITNAKVGADLQFTKEGLSKRNRTHFQVITVKTEWNSLKTDLPRLTAQSSDRQHQHLISDIRVMITHVGDTSNLILDPDLDSYYLMDVTLLALPQAQDRLANITAFGSKLLKNKGIITDKEYVQLKIDAAFLKEADLDRIRNSTQTALNEDQNFYGISETLQHNLPPLLQGYLDANHAFIGLINQAADSEYNKEIIPEQFLCCGSKAREASFHLWYTATDELDILLKKRIEHYENKKILALVLTGCALSAAISFVAFITRSISGPLQRQANELQATNESLKASEHFYHALVENLPQCVFRKDQNGHYIFANQLFCTLINKPLDEIIGKTDDDLFPMELARKHREEDKNILSFKTPDKSILSSQKTVGREEEFHLPNRDTMYMHVIKTPIHDNTGKPHSIQGIFLNITERKKSEAELKKAQQELVANSRLAGMAEIAIGVLHNVGNVLNSVNISATLISDHVQKSRMANLAKISSLLHEHKADLANFITHDHKGQQLPAYLNALAENFVEEQKIILKELRGLQKNIDHIKDIVAVQQNYARVSTAFEMASLIDLIQDALEMNSTALYRHKIKIVRDLPSLPPFKMDRHKILQILVNLISNAKYACSENSHGDKLIKIQATKDGDNKVKIIVIDNGRGIPPENLNRIFEHGFTTKKDGHGFGLHSSALAAKSLDGVLYAHSDGLGKGATFTLEVPFS